MAVDVSRCSSLLTRGIAISVYPVGDIHAGRWAQKTRFGATEGGARVERSSHTDQSSCFLNFLNFH